ncbi:DUF7544 domain-containing protein [Haloplanus salilacus]|uniref:DUF7544 domain-containing protein n=1 Tax=Haloplanus salilacus TaxID=2949994 RepID=UPI0030CCFC5D
MSRWYALAALRDARSATEDLLRPLDRSRWLRLALIALFVGVGGGAPTGSGNFDVPTGGGGETPSDFPAPTLPQLDGAVAVLIGVVALIVLLALLWSAVGAVMEFVLVVGLRDREIGIRRPFGDNLGRGLRLFGFRLAVGLGSLLLIAVPLVAVIGLGVSISPLLLVGLVPLVVLVGLLSIAGSVVVGLTTDFAVPTMLVEDRGVLDSWRRLWPTLRAEWKQVGVYLVAKFVLGIAASLAVSIVVFLVALVVAVPLALVGGGLYLAISAAGVGHAGLIVVAPLIVLFVLVMIVAALLVQVPVLTFVRYYSLSVLGMLFPDLDLVGVDRPTEDEDDTGGSVEADTDEATDTGTTGTSVDTDDPDR